MGEGNALAELLRNAGTQFDPAVALALAAVVARENGRRRSPPDHGDR
jgi:hypothetical protein